MFQRFQLLSLGFVALTLPGCALVARKPAAKPAPPQPRLVGTVSLVNEELGFVLVDATEIPGPGTALKAFTEEGAESAVLVVSPEQKRPFIIADIIKGLPHSGDRVFQ